MGLLLSVLVTCVGVVELLTFYHNVKRRVNYRQPETNLTSIRDQYLKDLEGVRDKLVHQLHFLKSQENVVPTHSSIPPTFRLNSHEDIDVKFNDMIVARSKSTSPRRFLVTEQESSSSPTRQFVVSEEPQAVQGIKKSHAQECIPEFLIEKQTAADVPRYVLKDENGPVQLPLPNTFLVSENEKENKNDVFRKKLGHNVVEVDGEIYYRRSPSPFPSFDLSAPRNSVCSELLDNSVSVAEIDELSRSDSHSPVNVSHVTSIEINNNTEKHVISENSSFRSTEHRNSRSLALPIRKSKSRSPSPNTLKKYKQGALQKGTLERCRSKSESNALSFIASEQTSSTSAVDLEIFDKNNASSLSESENSDDALNVCSKDLERLDGIDKTKEKVKKKLFNRKKNKDRSTSEDKSDLDLAESQTAFIPETMPLDKNDSCTAVPLATSENACERKTGEPFWVNH